MAFETHFLPRDLWLLSGSGLFLLSAVVCFVHNRIGLAVVLLTATAFLLRLAFVLMDPFVYDWDEQFHALVARHMTEHPFRPMLYEQPLLPYAISEWDHNHIWLHKQPLFLWMMALSMKIGGFTPLAAKLPSVLCSTLMVPAIYRIGKLIYTAATGFYAALLVAVGYVFINVVTGNLNTDHNDVIFSAFVLFSCWAFAEYAIAGKRRMRWWIGVLVGCAILVKWLPGLLVFGGWFCWLLLSRSVRRNRTAWADFAVAIGVALLVVLPWQVYIHVVFPVESAHELRYAALHFSIPIEGHDGLWSYHFLQLRYNFGDIVAWSMLAGWLLLLVVAKQRAVAWAFFAMVLAVFLFYTLAATKMPLFTLPVYPLLALGLAVLPDLLLRQVVRHPVRGYFVALPLIALMSWALIRLPHLKKKHTSLADEKSFRAQRIHDRAESDALAKEMGPGNWVIFGLNTGVAHYFYTGTPAYKVRPEKARLIELQQQGWKVAVYALNPNDTLPAGVYRITRRFAEE